MKNKFIKYLKKQFGGVAPDDDIYYKKYKEFYLKIQTIVKNARENGKKIMLIIEESFIDYNPDIIKNFIVPDNYIPIIFYERETTIKHQSDLNIRFDEKKDTYFFMGSIVSLYYDENIRFDLIIFDKYQQLPKTSFIIDKYFLSSVLNLVYDNKSIILIHNNEYPSNLKNEEKNNKIESDLFDKSYPIDDELISYNPYVYPNKIIDRIKIWFQNNIRDIFNFNQDSILNNNLFEYIKECKFIFNLESISKNNLPDLKPIVLFYNKNIWKISNLIDNTSTSKSSYLYLYITNIQTIFLNLALFPNNIPKDLKFQKYYNEILQLRRKLLLENYIINIRKNKILSNILIIGAVPSEKDKFSVNYDYYLPVYLPMNITPNYRILNCKFVNTDRICKVTIEPIYEKMLTKSFNDYPLIFNVNGALEGDNIKFDYIFFNVDICNKINFNKDKILQLCTLTYDDQSVIVFDRIDYKTKYNITNEKETEKFIINYDNNESSDIMPIYNIKVYPIHVMGGLVLWFINKFGDNIDINKHTYTFKKIKDYDEIIFCNQNDFFIIYRKIRDDPSAKPTILFHNSHRFYDEQLQEEYNGVKLYSIYIYLLHPKKLLQIYK